MQNKNVQYFDDETIRVYDIWLTIKKRKILIGIITLISFLCFFAYSLFAPNVYKISNILLMSLDKDVFNFSDKINPSTGIINMSEIKSAISLIEGLPKKQQIKIMDLDESIENVIKDINISENKEGRGLTLKVEVDTLDTQAGVKIINALTEYINKLPFLIKRIDYQKRFLQKNRDELKKIIEDPVRHLNLPDNIALSEILMSIYDLRKRFNKVTSALDELKKGKLVVQTGETIVPELPYKPKRLLLKLIGLAAGAFLGILSALFIEWVASARHEHETQK